MLRFCTKLDGFHNFTVGFGCASEGAPGREKCDLYASYRMYLTNLRVTARICWDFLGKLLDAKAPGTHIYS